jgi:hypothetical protein
MSMTGSSFLGARRIQHNEERCSLWTTVIKRPAVDGVHQDHHPIYRQRILMRPLATKVCSSVREFFFSVIGAPAVLQEAERGSTYYSP